MTRQKKTTLSRVLAYVWKYPFSLLGSLIFSLLSVAGSLCIPVFFGDAIDCIVGRGLVDFNGLYVIFIQVCIAVALAFIFCLRRTSHNDYKLALGLVLAEVG